MTYASRFLRFVGQFLDGLIGIGPLMMSFFMAPLLGGPILIVAGALWAMFYNLFADGLNDGRSLAKQWLGMRVIDAESGNPCTFEQSFVRNLLLAILGPIDWIFIFGTRHQRLGDKAAGTMVVRAGAN